MDRNANSTRLVRYSSRDCLTNPPGRISREFITTSPVKLVDTLHQTEIALLDQIQKLQAAVLILLGNRHHQPQISLSKLMLCFCRVCLTGHTHLTSALDLQRGNVLLFFQLFYSTFCRPNVSLNFFSVPRTQSFSSKLFRIILNLTLQHPGLFIDGADYID